MITTRLFHFSDNPSISIFDPRPVWVPSQRSAGMEWLNGPLVWAIEEAREYMYLFPRDCPRIILWATDETTEMDRRQWLGDSTAVAFVERHWWREVAQAEIYRYEFPTETFENLHDAGMWVSRQTVEPLGCETISQLPVALASRGVDVRVVESLVPLRHLWQSTLHVSGIRLRNARGWGSRSAASESPLAQPKPDGYISNCRCDTKDW